MTGFSNGPLPLAGCASLSPEISDFRDDERRDAFVDPRASVALRPVVSSRGSAARGAGAAGNPRGAAARGHHREHRDRGAWFERRGASFVIPEITDFRRQRGTAREREGAFGDTAITAEVRHSLVIKHYPAEFQQLCIGGPPSFRYD